MTLSWLIFIVSIAAAIGLLVWGLSERSTDPRKHAMLKLVSDASLPFEEYGPNLSLLEDTCLPFFTEGSARFGKFLFEFPEAHGIKAFYFDYSWMLGRDSEQQKKQATVALFLFENTSFPDFHICPEGGILGSTSSLKPVDTASFEKFQAGVQLYGEDPEALKDFFNSDVTSGFAEHPGWSAEVTKRALVIYKECSLVDPVRYREFIADAKNLVLILSRRADTIKNRN